MEKPPFGDGFSIICIRKPNSVLAIIYLGLLSPITSSGTSGVFENPPDTALHTGKNLAVSPVCFHTAFPDGNLAFLHRRLCSHLYGYPRQALPATLLLLAQCVFGLSSVTKVTVIARCTNK